MVAPELKDRRRVTWIGLLLFALFSGLIAQFYRLQIVQNEKWEARAIAQHEGRVTIPFRRGTFWSNVTVKEGHPERPQPLVRDVPKFHLHADPSRIPAALREELTAALIAHGGLDPTLIAAIDTELSRKARNRQLVRWLDHDQKEQLIAWWLPYARTHRIPRNALFFVKDYQRSYPFGKLLGQVLHTIRDYKDEETKQGVPTGGLEAYFNDLLKGKEGARLVVHSPRKRLEMGRVLEEPQDGADITLTINHYLQAVAEEELELGIARAQAKGGFAIMMDPYTGEILALAQYPSFAPAEYRDYFNDSDKIPDTLCQPLTYAFEPGSVMKPLIIALCLTANEELIARGEKLFFDPEQKVDVQNGRVSGRRRPLKDLGTHSFLNLDMGLQKSSNIYMGRTIEQLVNQMGEEWLYRALRERLLFATKTGLELPGESNGFVPRPGHQHPNGALEWSKATPYSLAMGYNLQVNGVQLVRAYAMLANGGSVVQPTLIKQITRQNGAEVVDDLRWRLAAQEPKTCLSPTACQRVLQSLRYVTKRGGSSIRADIPGFTEAGKSGSSEKLINGKYATDTHFSSFIGLAPAEYPRLVVLVSIDEPLRRYLPGLGSNHLGGKCAAPIFREICKRSLAYLGVSPDDPYGYPVGDPRRDTDRADWHTEVCELQAKYSDWNSPQS
jgi:cell division protein FtsI (penicillin-binding protein 3)